MKILMITLLLAASGCATSPTYDDTMKSWVGHPVDELISSWGPPAKEYKTASGKVLQFNYDGGLFFAYGAAIPRACKTVVNVDASDKIRSYQYDGNACKQNGPQS